MQHGEVNATPARRPRRSASRASFRKQLSGGDQRTLGDVDLVVSAVATQPQRLDELISCVTDSSDEIVRMRASDALEKVCRVRPALLDPHVALLLGEMSKIDQPSVRWHVAQMLGLVELSPQERGRAALLLCTNLEESSDWIVLNYSLDSLAVLARQDPQLVPDLLGYLRQFQGSNYKSLSSRANKLLAEFATKTEATASHDPSGARPLITESTDPPR